MAAKATKTSKKMTTYLIVHKDGTERKITVPDSWKVTFGPATKGANAGRGYSTGPRPQMPMALRFYESEKKQRAIFTDVVSFRDLSIKMEVKRVETQEKHGYMECEGARKATTFQAKTESWVDEDKPLNGVQLLPPNTFAEENTNG